MNEEDFDNEEFYYEELNEEDLPTKYEDTPEGMYGKVYTI